MEVKTTIPWSDQETCNISSSYTIRCWFISITLGWHSQGSTGTRIFFPLSFRHRLPELLVMSLHKWISCSTQKPLEMHPDSCSRWPAEWDSLDKFRRVGSELIPWLHLREASSLTGFMLLIVFLMQSYAVKNKPRRYHKNWFSLSSTAFFLNQAFLSPSASVLLSSGFDSVRAKSRY